MLQHIDGGGWRVPEGSHIGAIVQSELYVHQLLFRHFTSSPSPSSSLFPFLLPPQFLKIPIKWICNFASCTQKHTKIKLCILIDQNNKNWEDPESWKRRKRKIGICKVPSRMGDSQDLFDFLGDELLFFFVVSVYLLKY